MRDGAGQSDRPVSAQPCRALDLGKTPAFLVFSDAGSEGLGSPMAFQDSRNKRKCGARAVS